MAKKNSLKQYAEIQGPFGFPETDQPSDEIISDIMTGLVEASNHQLKIAIELTKIVVEKNPENMKEEHVFSTFKKAAKVVSENMPLKELMEKFN